MAAKSATAPKATAGKVTAKNNAAPSGLQLTTAQQAAYNKAFNATATLLRNRLALQSAATAFRKYRLNDARALVKAAQLAHRKAQAASIAAYAVRRTYIQSRLSAQNTALRNRVLQDLLRHDTLLGRAQYAAAGEKAFAHAAVMRTVTQAQALTFEAARFNAVSKTAKKTLKSVTPSKPTANSKAINAAANKAGLAAAAKVPKSRTAPAYANAFAAAAAAMAKATPKAPGAIDWLGDEVTPNCVIIALANHLLYVKNIRATEEQITELARACPAEPTIEQVLWQAWLTAWPYKEHVRLGDYAPADYPASEQGCLIIGYATENGDHAALSLAAGKVVSWGSVIDREAPVEEAWQLRWDA